MENVKIIGEGIYFRGELVATFVSASATLMGDFKELIENQGGENLEEELEDLRAQNESLENELEDKNREIKKLIEMIRGVIADYE